MQRALRVHYAKSHLGNKLARLLDRTDRITIEVPFVGALLFEILFGHGLGLRLASSRPALRTVQNPNDFNSIVLNTIHHDKWQRGERQLPSFSHPSCATHLGKVLQGRMRS